MILHFLSTRQNSYFTVTQYELNSVTGFVTLEDDLFYFVASDSNTDISM
jgi:hypothetical protein